MVCQVNDSNNAKQHQSLQQVLNNINKFFFKNNFVQAYSWGLDIAGCYVRAKHLLYDNNDVLNNVSTVNAPYRILLVLGTYNTTSHFYILKLCD